MKVPISLIKVTLVFILICGMHMRVRKNLRPHGDNQLEK